MVAKSIKNDAIPIFQAAQNDHTEVDNTNDDMKIENYGTSPSRQQRKMKFHRKTHESTKKLRLLIKSIRNFYVDVCIGLLKIIQISKKGI